MRPFLYACVLALGVARAQAPPDVPVAGEPIVVTATRTEREALDVPASVDVIDTGRMRAGQAQVNLSETLPALPGVVANHRQNYAQDLQVSIRGFGARSTFGVRGLRVIVDGIPATLPDGQAQVSHVDLASAGRIEVLRGPFSVLYGNSSGGVIAIETQAPAPQREAGVTAMAGSDAARRVGALLSGTQGAAGYTISAGRFEADGYRQHSRVVRDVANAKVRWQWAPGTSATLVANALDMPDTQDPLGLTREQFEAAPRSVAPAALLFNTRKSVDQAQAGAVLEHAIDPASSIRLALYAGERGTQQFQAIPVAPQASPLHPGGVIDLARRYSGLDARWTWNGTIGAAPLTVVAGANHDRLAESRRGFQNFVGTRLGVMGALRRDETNRVSDSGVYAQAEWDVAPTLRLLAGVRASRVEFRSQDHYVTAANPDDSGRTAFEAATPVAGVAWRVAAHGSVYAAAGRGFETPTTNELAYRAGGASGPNLQLDAARSRHRELGAKWSDPRGWKAGAAAFHVETRDEIVVESNVGGRSTFRNAGRTEREGVELQAARDWNRLGVSAALTWLSASYVEGFGATTGRRIPGVPRESAFVELRWRPREATEIALEARHTGSVPVDDANSDAAPAYTVANLRFTSRWRIGRAELKPFVRVDNVFGRRYAGSVIVNEGNRRFFEPAPGRTWLAGVGIVLGN